MTDIYHITHIDNLESIIDAGGLWCDAEVANGRVEALGIAHRHIKARRARTEVHLPPGGILCDYVPFYFGPRSPMLYAINKGGVRGYQGGQNEILHLVAGIEDIANRGLPFVFTDGHAVIDISKFYNDLGDLHVVDWELMKSRWWNDTQEFPDRLRRRQAEFLVHHFLPWELISKIGVRLTSTQTRVQAIIEQKSHGHNPQVEREPSWYY